MMIGELLSTCDSRFQAERHKKSCAQCTYEGYCPHEFCECEKCLELIHYPDRVAEGAPARNYDCTHMADFYVCKYACKYASELVYAFRRLKDIIPRRNLKVLSFGCGPCTDLLALDYLRWNDTYCFESLDYRGVDYGEEVWSNIHNDIKQICPDEVQVRFSYMDAQSFITRIATQVWAPDLVVFQYFFSDMYKNAGEREVRTFVNDFAEYANSRMPIDFLYCAE
jgi:hypothetical protein